MGRDDDESMATFASVAAMSQKQLPPSPTKTAENTSETCLFETSISPKENDTSNLDIVTQPAQTHRDNIFESFEPSRLLEECQLEKETPVKTETTISNHESHNQTQESADKESESADVSCDTCLQLQANSDIEQSCSSPAPRSPQSYVEKLSKKLVTKSVKHLKRKLKKGKSKKFTRLKKSKYPAAKIPKPTEEYSECTGSAEVFDFDSSVRSACSESEPLPVFNHQKRYHSDSESDSDETVSKKRKIRPLIR